MFRAIKCNKDRPVTLFLLAILAYDFLAILSYDFGSTISKAKAKQYSQSTTNGCAAAIANRAVGAIHGWIIRRWRWPSDKAVNKNPRIQALKKSFFIVSMY